MSKNAVSEGEEGVPGAASSRHRGGCIPGAEESGSRGTKTEGHAEHMRLERQAGARGGQAGPAFCLPA